MLEEQKGAKYFLPKVNGFVASDKLTTAHHYRKVFQSKPKVAHHKYSMVLAIPNKHPRLGLAITKKHCKRAVDRNRIKRVIREQFRMQKHQIKPQDIVFVSKPGLAKQNKTQLHKMAASLLQKIT